MVFVVAKSNCCVCVQLSVDDCIVNMTAVANKSNQLSVTGVALTATRCHLSIGSRDASVLPRLPVHDLHRRLETSGSAAIFAAAAAASSLWSSRGSGSQNRNLNILMLAGDKTIKVSKKRSSCSSTISVSSAAVKPKPANFSRKIVVAAETGKKPEDNGCDDDVFHPSPSGDEMRRRRTIGHRPSPRDVCWSPSSTKISRQRLGSRGTAGLISGLSASPPQIEHHDIVKVSSPFFRVNVHLMMRY